MYHDPSPVFGFHNVAAEHSDGERHIIQPWQLVARFALLEIEGYNADTAS